MVIILTIISVLTIILLAAIVISYICYRMAFYVRDCDKKSSEEFPIPEGEIYEPFREKMVGWIKETRQLPHQTFEVKSFDGLTLRAKYYEQIPGAPIELMFHGYRGYAERDLCGGVQRCFALGHNAFIVDQRASGDSDGNVISFGINESKDCHTWLALMCNHFGPDVQILLTGISMGASTVLNAAAAPLPGNVIGILADCGFSSPKAIIQKVILDMKLPVRLAYPFVWLGGKLFGHFDLNEITSENAVKKCTIPVLFFHGDNDAYVPWQMSRINYDACTCRKKLVLIPGAGHGLSYPVAPALYIEEMHDFFHGNNR